MVRAQILIAALFISASAEASGIEEIVMHPQRDVPSLNISGKEQVDCGYIKEREPFVILAAGQSLVANSNGDYPWDRTITKNVYEHWDGRCYKANAPLYGGSDGRQSFVLPLAAHISRSQNRDVLIAVSAIGAEPISSFLNGRGNELLAAQINSLSNSDLKPSAVIWQHGQADLGRPYGDYKDDLSSLVRIIRDNDVSAPIFISIDTMAEWVQHDELRDESQSIYDEFGVFKGPNIDLIRYRYDGTHLDQRGMELQAAMWFATLADHFDW